MRLDAFSIYWLLIVGRERFHYQHIVAPKTVANPAYDLLNKELFLSSATR